MAHAARGGVLVGGLELITLRNLCGADGEAMTMVAPTRGGIMLHKETGGEYGLWVGGMGSVGERRSHHGCYGGPGISRQRLRQSL